MPERTQHRFVIRSLSVVLALVLWFFVTWERPAERRFSVPLLLVNIPAGLTVSGAVPQTVDVTVSGPRLPLILLNPVGRAVYLDLATSGEGITAFPNLERSLSLPDQLRVTGISPARIEVQLQKRTDAGKRVP